MPDSFGYRTETPQEEVHGSGGPIPRSSRGTETVSRLNHEGRNRREKVSRHHDPVEIDRSLLEDANNSPFGPRRCTEHDWGDQIGEDGRPIKRCASCGVKQIRSSRDPEPLGYRSRSRRNRLRRLMSPPTPGSQIGDSDQGTKVFSRGHSPTLEIRCKGRNNYLWHCITCRVCKGDFSTSEAALSDAKIHQCEY